MKNRLNLLSKRICDLKLDLTKSPLFSYVQELYDELAARKLIFRPPCYFADEWFVPEGDPVIGIPFFLANKKLMGLEKKLTGDVEGDTKNYFMKLLRHEAGHALCYAFKLNRLKKVQSVFGSSNKKFSETYRFNPRSKNYVINLKDYYAQSHPDEDFAETFAVWLSHSQEALEKKYKGWNATKKLVILSRLMKDIENKAPLIKTGKKMCHVTTLKYTLSTYYKRKCALQSQHLRVHEK